jgi:hypothetical protein
MTVEADIADKTTQRCGGDRFFQTGKLNEPATFLAVVEETMRAPFSQITKFVMGCNGTAWLQRLLENDLAQLRAPTADKGGNAQTGNAGANDTKVVIRWFQEIVLLQEMPAAGIGCLDRGSFVLTILPG